MPPGGSTDAAVKAASPEWGRSEAESLDSAAVSPTMETVMSRTHRAGCCGGIWSAGAPGECPECAPTTCQSRFGASRR